MFQSFKEKTQTRHSAKRTDALRKELAARDLDGFVVARSDEHQGEYVGPHSERLAWLTGFTGSAGIAIVTQDKAAIFVDGRYTLQSKEQTDASIYEQCHLIKDTSTKWIVANLKAGDRLGLDPWLHTVKSAKLLKTACAKVSAKLVAVDSNPIDVLWTDRPTKPRSPVYAHPTRYAGASVQEKSNMLNEALKRAGASATVLTIPESVAWAFNIRGSDVAHTPVALVLAIVRRDGRDELFLEAERLDGDGLRQLEDLVEIKPPELFQESLGNLAGVKVLVDPAWCAKAIERALEAGGAQIISGADPCLLPKARKNEVEQEGARLAHVRDGAAMVEFLHWLDAEASLGNVTEISAAKKLEACRAETGLLKEISFDSISAAGPHAALPHYRVNESSNLKLEPGMLYLIDSGGQYLDGTTDITRTIAIGSPTDEMRDRYTRVLKGHIAIASVRFPKGTSGAQIDSLARLALWEAGLDFDHGTGHGVGSFLSVHEGPQQIAKTGVVPLEPGMILSNEPGYYKPDGFGIRIENLVIVQETKKRPGEERTMYGLETISLCPIDVSVIDRDLLNNGELTWLNNYHSKVREKLAPKVEGEVLDWLEQKTQPL